MVRRTACAAGAYGRLAVRRKRSAADRRRDDAESAALWACLRLEIIFFRVSVCFGASRHTAFSGGIIFANITTAFFAPLGIVA